MVTGIKTFKCDDCGKLFIAPSIELNATSFAAPVPCPGCGKSHTYPIGLSNLGGLLGPGIIYKKIWKDNDSRGNR